MAAITFRSFELSMLFYELFLGNRVDFIANGLFFIGCMRMRSLLLTGR